MAYICRYLDGQNKQQHEENVNGLVSLIVKYTKIAPFFEFLLNQRRQKSHSY